MTKRNSKSTGITTRILISLVGIALILVAARDVWLVVIGKAATATVTTEQYDDSPDFNEPIELQYKWKVSWTFTVDGKEYSGSRTAKGSATAVRHGNAVFYFPFAPQINSLDADESVGVTTIILTGLGILLIAVVNAKRKKSETPKECAPQNQSDEYSSERIEPMSKFCSICGTQLQEDAKFCPSCGNPVVRNRIR